MDQQDGDISPNEMMRQFAQALVRVMQYGQRDVNVARAAQGQTLAPGSSFGPPDMEVSQADQPPATLPKPSRDVTWAEQRGLEMPSSDDMIAMRQRAVQQARQRQVDAIGARDSLLLSGVDPRAAEPPRPAPENLNVGETLMVDGAQWTRTSQTSWTKQLPESPAPPPQQPPPPPPSVVVRTPPVPDSSDTWGNWQGTQVETTETSGTDNTQPTATKIGADLRTQLTRMNGNMERLFGDITSAIIQLNQRIERIEAGFESREPA